MPPVVVPACTAVLLVAGLAVRGPAGTAALVVLAVFLGWIGYLSWPKINAQGKLLRILAVGVVLCLTVYQAMR